MNQKKKLNPADDPCEALKRIRAVQKEVDQMQKAKREAKRKIEKVCDISYLLILLKLANQENYTQRKIQQDAIIERMDALGLNEASTAEEIAKHLKFSQKLNNIEP